MKSKKTKICKKKEVVIKAKQTVAKKSSNLSKIFTLSLTKKSRIETKSKSLDSDSQSEVTQSVLSRKKIIPEKLTQKHVDKQI